jgi:hypothetical protein
LDTQCLREPVFKISPNASDRWQVPAEGFFFSALIFTGFADGITEFQPRETGSGSPDSSGEE